MDKLFKLSSFNKWMKKIKLTDQKLYEAVNEIKEGLIDAELGDNIVKKRISLPGHGKRGATRTLIATNRKNLWIFLGPYCHEQYKLLEPKVMVQKHSY